ncbi:16S rRNA (cytidine(1402)-2'-O)-methyltransferase [Campylobacter troglodytis]|uniref:16S rRNA (cytidine(1402)-2'-O)-methyltransferase n=1 Tax=Campylobacter troglodytis TaxID=654363 RepID=UPI0011595ADD|nr:16S rRNA (cytidine(1402)-2'-O)-methyltransferase [Campylobacter troglodytis]TQR60798.1 16S rRNA (cytidine(1402)-2'-O)-methyltransferase [Campylobacter troglodytis]
MLYFIPTPIGNLGDISYRSLELLKTCELVFCEDTRVCKALFVLLNEKFGIKIAPARFVSLHSHNERQVLASLDKAIFNQNVAYLSDAGMPCISDPGLFLIRYAQQNGIDYEVLSGANAALVALAASGLCEKEFIFMGFLSSKKAQRQKELEKVLANPYPSIIYESPKRILALVSELARISPQRECFAIKEISKKFEKKFKGNAKTLAKTLENENLNGEWVLVLAAKDENADEKKGIFLSKDEIMALSLSTKDKARLLAQIEKKQTKELYHKLLSQNKV